MDRSLMYIDGEWTESQTGRWRVVEDPSTEEAFCEVPEGDAADAGRAVDAARRAFEDGPWPRMSPEDRRDFLLRLRDCLRSRIDELTTDVTRETGCPIRLSKFMQVAVPIENITDFANAAPLLDAVRGNPIQERPLLGQSEVRRTPVGVCAGFSPFNFPLMMNIWKMAPAVAMGNCVVLKSSPLTPLAGLALARACDEVGFPNGVVNVVSGDVEVGERLASHPKVRMVSFTGSTAVGRRIMGLASETVKRVTLELGGKSPSIILDDADLELAVKGSLFGAFIHGGQACTATTRLLVPAARFDDIIDLVREETAKITVGPSADPRSDMGPLVSKAQLNRVESFVTSALDQGAKLLVGGKRADPTGTGKGHFYEPSVLIDVTGDMQIAREEVFGPVLAVLRYDSDDEAIKIANDSQYGLGASVWSADLGRARTVASGIEAGAVWINEFGVVTFQTPWGGVKQSGFGREFGEEGMLEYTELKTVYTALDQNVHRRAYALGCAAWR